MSLEESILALTAAVIANTAAMGTAPKASKAKKGETESAPTQTASPPTAPAPVAGVAAIVASAPTSPVAANPQLLNQTTEAVILLANEYSREKALGILAKRRGSVKCSQLTPEELPGVLAEVQAAIVAEKAAKEAATANASLV